MQKSRKEIDNEDKGREIIEDYANFASKVYDGITREGLSLDKIAGKYEVQPVALNTYKGLTELSTTIKPSILETTINVAQFIKTIYEGNKRYFLSFLFIQRTVLIEELLTVAKIPDLPEAEQEEILMQQHEEKVKNASLEAIQGEVIAETLDMLSKELFRIKQEKRIAQMEKSAEEDRRLREIKEAGTRQAEQILRDRKICLIQSNYESSLRNC
ncbi:unnamed protein product (macronuclear) [Paramecium tetraurelia]|uniref:HTH psq-type domain-containing protein n=1 Tax=Paramecium tetraurelia TaxID=5888 RepID=A0BD77_PARTE|nr:uncharacterized protein GSPATT00004588001 [Paramecium tetraurelia]CAK56494.1 unnamed protein product [Paramecium tetraurelia]|eukprot:XP_001423892.1 hypothetical protein (macronuclear) [Paramecium tetraurelia strain d4-2]